MVGAAEATRTAEGWRWAYDMDVPAGAETWRVACEEELATQTDNVAACRIRIAKFGLLIVEMQLILSRARPLAVSDAPAE